MPPALEWAATATGWPWVEAPGVGVPRSWVVDGKADGAGRLWWLNGSRALGGVIGEAIGLERPCHAQDGSRVDSGGGGGWYVSSANIAA